MKIDVARLDKEGETFEGEDPADILEWDANDVVMHPSAPVHYRLTAQTAGSELLVRGSVSTRFEGICVRCGDPIAFEVKDDELCTSYPISDDTVEVDLTPELRETILFALPENPVCSPDCPGLCPRCGRKLKNGPCHCQSEPEGAASNAFGALDPAQFGAGPAGEKKRARRPKSK